MQLDVQWFLSALVENDLMSLERGIEMNNELGGDPDIMTFAQEILNVLCENASESDAQNWASQLEDVIVFAQEQAAAGNIPAAFQNQPPPPPEPVDAFAKLKMATARQSSVISEQQKAQKSTSPSSQTQSPSPSPQPSSSASSSKATPVPESVPSSDTETEAAAPAPVADNFNYDINEMPNLREVASMSDGEVAETMRNLLLCLRAYGASDLHVSANSPLFIRRSLLLERIDPEWVIPAEDAVRLNEALLTPDQREKFHKEQDMSFGLQLGRARFRTALMYQKDGVSGSYRLVPDQVMTLEDLGFLPADAKNLRRLLDYTNGLILVTGPLGSGKTTTLAAMIEVANQNREDHIITVEDPIEIVQESKNCQITQREIGRCTNSYHAALKGALREDPDIIVIGEMHDLETIENAITASETGHLVIGTLHTCDAGNTLNRVLDVFPPAQQAQIRAMTAGSLRGIICQRLIPSATGGLTIAYEILINTIAVGNIISEGKIHQLRATMQIGSRAGMCTLDQNLLDKYKAGMITYETALYYMKDSSIVDQAKKFFAMKQAQQFAAERAAIEAANPSGKKK